MQAFLVGRTATSRAGGAGVPCRQHTELESADWPLTLTLRDSVRTFRRFFGDVMEKRILLESRGKDPGQVSR